MLLVVEILTAQMEAVEGCHQTLHPKSVAHQERIFLFLYHLQEFPFFQNRLNTLISVHLYLIRLLAELMLCVPLDIVEEIMVESGKVNVGK